MTPFSPLSIVRGIGYLLVFIVCVNCKKEYNSTVNPLQQPPSESFLTSSGFLSQTRTATFLNNLNNFQQVFGDQGYPRAKATDVAADDGIYAYTNKLTAARDSAGPFRSSSASSLSLQGFGFTIPDGATIENIYIRLRRFKTGGAPVGDYFLSLMQRYQCGSGPCTYGMFWTKNDTYAGKIYPNTETEYVFSQSGSGIDGGFNHDQSYDWTPAIINHEYFGVRIDSYPPIGKGTATIYYDLVEVTVEYSQPVTQ